MISSPSVSASGVPLPSTSSAGATDRGRLRSRPPWCGRRRVDGRDQRGSVQPEQVPEDHEAVAQRIVRGQRIGCIDVQRQCAGDVGAGAGDIQARPADREQGIHRIGRQHADGDRRDSGCGKPSRSMPTVVTMEPAGAPASMAFPDEFTVSTIMEAAGGSQRGPGADKCRQESTCSP